MRVTFNHFPDTLLGRLQSLGREQNKALIQLSTGQRIDAPSDDAPAMQRVLNLRTEKKQNQQFYRNAIDGLERSKVSFSSLEQIKDLLVRASELSANISGASSEQEYKAKAAEIDQLIQQGVNVANTRLRGNFLFSGDTTLQQPFNANFDSNGKVTSVSYSGSADAPQIRIGEGETSILAVAATPQENGDIAGVLNDMIRMRDTMLEFDAEKVIALRTGATWAAHSPKPCRAKPPSSFPKGTGSRRGTKSNSRPPSAGSSRGRPTSSGPGRATPSNFPMSPAGVRLKSAGFPQVRLSNASAALANSRTSSFPQCPARAQSNTASRLR